MPQDSDTIEHYSAIVVGAGPAGAMAAYHAAPRGRVLLIDCARLPRDKSCGGMLNEHTQAFLGEYGRIPDDMISRPEWVNFRFHDWDRGILKPTELRFSNVDRKRFDEWLLALLPSEVTVWDSTTLESFADEGDRVRVRVRHSGGNKDLSCDNLIGCDGPRSSVRRGLGSASVATYVTLQDFCAIQGDIDPVFDCIYMRGIGDSFGYAYVVPKGDVAIVGSVFYPKTKRPYEKHDEILSRLTTRMPLGPSVKREAWVALCVRHRRDILEGRGRVLLAGEAGGFMSPTSGEGISYALNSGRQAGAAVAGSSADEALGDYVKRIQPVTDNIRRKLKWLPFMESRAGKYVAGFVPDGIVSSITKGL
jgi:flavin-dependent dehydrogenase